MTPKLLEFKTKTWMNDFEAWETNNIGQAHEHEGEWIGRYLGVSGLDVYGFPYRPFQYIPIDKRYSAFLEYRAAMRAWLLDFKMRGQSDEAR